MAKPRRASRRRRTAPKRSIPDRTNLHWAAQEYAAYRAAVKPA